MRVCVWVFGLIRLVSLDDKTTLQYALLQYMCTSISFFEHSTFQELGVRLSFTHQQTTRTSCVVDLKKKKTGVKSKTDGMLIEATRLVLESNWQQLLVPEWFMQKGVLARLCSLISCTEEKKESSLVTCSSAPACSNHLTSC